MEHGTRIAGRSVMVTILILGASFIGVACLGGGVATLAGPAAGTAVEERLAILTGNATQPGKNKSDEPALLQTPLNEGPNFLEEFVKRFFNLRAFLQRAGTTLTPSKFLFLSIGIGVAAMVLLPLLRVPLA